VLAEQRFKTDCSANIAFSEIHQLICQFTSKIAAGGLIRALNSAMKCEFGLCFHTSYMISQDYWIKKEKR
jgi:hypothetical protein